MTLYRRIAAVTAPEEIDELRSELNDRFGRPPAPVRRLLEVMRVRAAAGEQGVLSLVAGKKHLGIEFESARFLGEDIKHALDRQFGGAVQFTWNQRPGLQLALDGVTDPVAAANDLIVLLAAAG